MKLIIAGCCKNVGRFLPTIFKNIDQLRTLATEVRVVFAHDRSNDDTLLKLENYYFIHADDTKILLNNNHTPTRTINIAAARNSIMDYVRKNHADYDLICFLDTDDIIDKPFNLSTFEKTLAMTDQWDALSFNRHRYYDIWALRYEPYLRPCWSWGGDSGKVVALMQGEITHILNNMAIDELYPVQSAFNGVALFKLNKFLNAKFDGLYHPPPPHYNPFPSYRHVQPYDDCEWPNFYNNARRLNPDLRVMISPLLPY